MTQYHQERPPTTAVDPVDRKVVQERNALEQKLESLTDRVQRQDEELKDLRKTIKRLQTDIRSAITAFNLKNHG